MSTIDNLKEKLTRVRELLGYALGPTRDVKTPKLQEAFSLVDDLIADLKKSEALDTKQSGISRSEGNG